MKNDFDNDVKTTTTVNAINEKGDTKMDKKNFLYNLVADLEPKEISKRHADLIQRANAFGIPIPIARKFLVYAIIAKTDAKHDLNKNI